MTQGCICTFLGQSTQAVYQDVYFRQLLQVVFWKGFLFHFHQATSSFSGSVVSGIVWRMLAAIVQEKNPYCSTLFNRSITSWIIAFSHLWNRNIEGQTCWMILFILLPSVDYHSRLMKYSLWNTRSAIEWDLEDLWSSISAVMYLVWRLVMAGTMRDMADCWFLFL